MHPFEVGIFPSEDVVHCTTDMVCAVTFIEGDPAQDIVAKLAA